MDHDIAPSVADICNAIGRDTIAASVGVGLTAVSNAVVDGRFPARWFFVVKKLCAEAGIECPEKLFSFAGVSSMQEGATP